MEREFFKERDLVLLKRNITPDTNKDEFYAQVDDDYTNGNLVSISITEYKNMLFQDFFIQRLISNGLRFWPMYEQSKEDAVKLYTITANVAKKTTKKLGKNE